jgi:cell division septal protein FtsQ
VRVSQRRRKRSPVARIRPFWVPIGLCVASVLAGLAFAATWSGFDPKAVDVSGNQRVSRHEILGLAAVTPHESIWLQDPGAIAKRIESIPYIATARVRRVPPAAIRIVVSERVPFAILRSDDDAVIVDRALRVLESATPDANYPVLVLESGVALEPGTFVRRPSALRLREAYDAIEARHIAATELQYDRFGGLVVTIRGGLRLLLGSENDLGQKLILADAILGQIVAHQRRVAAIDVRAPSAPVLVYR